jgi:nitrate/nitrite transporter NarK
MLTDPKYVPITAPKDRKQANWKIQLNPAFTTVAVLALIGVMSLRATSQSAFTSFVPQSFTIVGTFSNQEAGTLSFLMLGALAAGSFTGGMLADRVGPQRVMVASLLATAPLMAIMILLGDYRAFFIAPILGFASGAAWPPMLVMSQTLFHKNAGVGTGIALGFVFAMGGVGTSLTGWLAVPERMGLLAAPTRCSSRSRCRRVAAPGASLKLFLAPRGGASCINNPRNETARQRPDQSSSSSRCGDLGSCLHPHHHPVAPMPWWLPCGRRSLSGC